MKNFSTPSGRPAASAVRAEAHRQAGLAAQRAKRWDAAAAEFEHAADLAPADALMWINLGRSRMQLGRHEAALAAALRAFELDRASTIACRMAAELQLQMNRPADALATFEALTPPPRATTTSTTRTATHCSRCAGRARPSTPSSRPSRSRSTPRSCTTGSACASWT